MLKIQLTDNVYSDFGSIVPAWDGNYQLSNTWSLPSNTVQGWGGSIQEISSSQKNVFLQYGSNNSDAYWASIRFFKLEYQLVNEVLQEDGTITADFIFSGGTVRSTLTDYSYAGVGVTYEFKMDGVLLATWSGSTTDIMNISLGGITKSISLVPQEIFSGFNLDIHISYSDGDVSDTTVGANLINAIPPLYVPMSTRKSGVWKNLDDNGGNITLRKDGEWQDYSYETTTTSLIENVGKNRIRKDSKWLQLPKM